ncbi:LOS biosynthesis enzyme LBGB [Endomicrobiia bacterium]|nr:LOS biosynthesis enzyme LBGB [Endomicrobiia bacterium]
MNVMKTNMIFFNKDQYLWDRRNLTMRNILKNKLKSFKKSLAKTILDKRSKLIKSLDINQIKSILFFRDDDKIGDIVVSTLLFREIKKKYPGISIVVLCGKNNREILKYNNNVNQIYETGKNFFKNILLFRKLKKRNISLAVDFYTFRPRFKRLLMLRIVSAEFLIGFYKDSYNIYDLSIDVNFFNKHISKRYEYLLNILKIEKPDLKYDVTLNFNEENKAFELVKKCGSKCSIVLNPFAASKHRSFSFNKLKELVGLLENKIDCCLFILCQGSNKKEMKSLENDRTFIISFKSILESAALIKYAEAVITPDTSIVHIATAFNKKTVALYLDYSDAYEKIDTIWGPNNPNAIQLSVNTKNKRLKNDIKNIPNMDILNALQKLL